MTMHYRDVKSSQMKRIGYDAVTRTLHIEFSSGHRYEYEGIPPALHGALVRSESKGTYFHKHIRNGGYAYRKLEQ